MEVWVEEYFGGSVGRGVFWWMGGWRSVLVEVWVEECFGGGVGGGVFWWRGG